MTQPEARRPAEIRPYTNGEIVVYWDAAKCIHSAICAKGLPEVFQPRRRPWIRLDKSNTESIVSTVDRCPSGALTWRRVGAAEAAADAAPLEIQLLPDGPLLVKGEIQLLAEDGSRHEAARVALCRCGASSRKPFCDGSHVTTGFRSRAAEGE